jgi:hypothetical protein
MQFVHFSFFQSVHSIRPLLTLTPFTQSTPITSHGAFSTCRKAKAGVITRALKTACEAGECRAADLGVDELCSSAGALHLRLFLRYQLREAVDLRLCCDAFLEASVHLLHIMLFFCAHCMCRGYGLHDRGHQLPMPGRQKQNKQNKTN